MAGAALQLVLASASPRRGVLLEAMGIRYRREPADVEEWDASHGDPRELVAHNAGLKADAVARRLPREPVLAADTTVALDGHILNKPTDLDDARRMLRHLSGRTHEVYTAVSLRWLDAGISEDFIECSQVRFRDLDAARIEDYLRAAHVLDKAGAYGIQESGDLIIAAYHGSLDNIIGLPTERLRSEFERLGWLPRLLLACERG